MGAGICSGNASFQGKRNRRTGQPPGQIIDDKGQQSPTRHILFGLAADVKMSPSLKLDIFQTWGNYVTQATP